MKTLKEGIEELKTALKPMTFGEKITHLWMYYKWVLFTVVAVVAGISIIVNAITARDPLFSGATMNLMLSAEGRTYITDDWKAQLSDDPKEWVDLEEMFTSDNAAMVGQDAVTATLQLSVMIASGELDYVMIDKETLGFFLEQGAFSDLREILTDEQMDRLGNRVLHVSDGTVSYPAAVEITATEFVKKSMAYTEAVYIAFPGNTGRSELADDFLEYLLNWQ